MTQEMPGQRNNLKHRKRKRSSEPKNSRKASSTRRKRIKSPKTQPAAESGAAVAGPGKAAGHAEGLSRISCECHQSVGGRRCSASPELRGREGKENERRPAPELDDCRLRAAGDKRELEEMDYQETGKNIYPDDDSNQILPVEQFFGNLDTVQDFPQQTSATSSRVQRRHRRRHYYARDDSEEEEEEEAAAAAAAGISSLQRDDRGGTL